MTFLTFTILGLAVFRMSRLVVSDTIIEPARLRVLARYPSSSTVFMSGGEGRVWVPDLDGWIAEKPSWLGELISCVWCVSIWISVVVMVVWWVWPVVVWWLTPLALSAVAGIVEEVTDGFGRTAP